MDAYPPVGDPKATRPELPSHVIPAEEIAAALAVLASGRPLTMPALADEEET